MKIDEAIKELKDCNPLTGDDKNDSKHFEAVDMAIKSLDRTRLIPVSEPPKCDDNFLIYDKRHGFRTAIYQKGTGWVCVECDGYAYEVAPEKYMPLPPAPEQEV